MMAFAKPANQKWEAVVWMMAFGLGIATDVAGFFPDSSTLHVHMEVGPGICFDALGGG
jgi:hypothetical protein